MFLPAKMSNVTILVYDSDVERVTAEILHLGMLQISDTTEVSEWAKDLTSVVNDEMMERYARLEERIRAVGAKLGRPIEIHPGEVQYEDLDPRQISDFLDETEREAEEYIENKRLARQEISRLMSVLSEAKSGLSGRVTIDVHGPFSFLEVREIRMTDKYVPILHSLLKGVPSVILPVAQEGQRRDMMVMVLRGDRRILDEALREIPHTKVEPKKKSDGATDPAYASEIRDKILKEEKDLNNANDRLADIAEKNMQRLSNLLNLVHTRKVIHQAQHHFKRTNRTYLISGWIPASNKTVLISKVRDLTGNRCYIEEISAEELGAKVEIPVMFKNPGFLKPFEMLTSGYGIPKYNTLDPTLFLALSFVVMFGAMFGDVGHGGVLALTGLYMLFRKGFSDSTRRFGGLLMYAGVSAMIFGFIYGSFFGPSRMSGLLPYEGREPINPENIQFYLRMAVYFGIGFLTFGIILNIINSIRTREFFTGVFSREGLIGGVMYWVGVILIARFLTRDSIGISINLLLILLFVPVILFFLRAPIKKIFKPSEPMFHDGIMLYLMESVIELVEIYAGYLSNTMSFIRVAAFALAHGGLFIAVYAIAGVMGRFGIIAHVFGNLGIILLEGLIVSIQAIRLEYYEFFSKFFRSGRRGYEPSNMMEVK